MILPEDANSYEQRLMRRRVSSHDVAREAGVSQSTVSLVLNGKSDARISEQTRQRVLEAARKLNYSRNAMARALVTGRTHRIGVVPNHPGSFLNRNMYYGDILAGVTEGALRCNYNLLLHASQYADWQGLYEDILSGAADGVLLVGRYPEDALTERLIASGFPTVCVSYHPDQEGYYAVDCDNEAGGYMAVRRLLDLGRRQIALISPGDSSSWARERRIGAQRAWEDAGRPAEQFVVLHAAELRIWEPGGSASAIEAITRLSPRVTGLVCSDEVYAQMIAETLPEYGLRVPEDLAIIGFNSTEISARCRPPLTSVWQPLQAIGAAAVEMLSDLIEGREIAPGVKRFPMRLDIRASCGATQDP